MQTTSITLLAAAVFAAAGIAQEPQQVEVNLAKPDARRDAALELAQPAFAQFVTESGGSWDAAWNYATETPKAIWGTGLPLADWRGDSIEEARRHMTRLMEERRELLRLGASEYREIIGTKVNHTYVFVLDQFFNNVPVLEGRADFRINDQGVVAMFGSQAFDVPVTFSTLPALTSQQASMNVLTVMNDGQELNAPAAANSRLVIWADHMALEKAPVHLAWEIGINTIQDNGDGRVGRYMVDANTGAVLTYLNDKHDCGLVCSSNTKFAGSNEQPTTASPVAARLNHAMANRSTAKASANMMSVAGNVRGWVNITSRQGNPTTNVPLQGLTITVPGIGNTVTDANGDFSIATASTTPVSVTIRLDGEFTGPLVGAGVPTVTQTITPGTPGNFQFSTSNANEQLKSAMDVYYWVDRTNRYVRNLLANPNAINGINNITSNVNIASNCNAFYNGNSINFYTSGGGCNNTGFSTVISHEWGHGVDDVLGGISQTNGLSEGWGDIIGLYITGQPILGDGFSTGGGNVRTGLNNRQYPQGGGVHAQGESWMGWAWDVRTALIASNGGPAGTIIAESIVIGSIVADATNQPDAVREVFILDDNDGNLANGVPHYAELSAAALGRSLPFPEVQLGTIAHTPLTSTTEQLTPREISATLAPIGGTFTSANVIATVGGQSVTSPMFNTGGNQWTTLVQGDLAPSSVSYAIVANHSTGGQVRLPRTGNFSFNVGAETIFFGDDFESGANGWTHALVATQDDWQQGAPSATNSAGDATSAPSGVAIWGNDLSIGNFNGLYQNNVNNYLRSPVINLAGQTGVKIRFKRWLTVESGQFDQAEIRLNNTVIWSNPQTTDLIDTSWVDFELDVPAAAGMANAQFEFRMITDASVVFGGWNIDDFEVFATGTLPPLPAELEITPATPTLGQLQTLRVKGDPNAPMLLALANTPGPTTVPGVGTFQVGGNILVLPTALDGAGNLMLTFNAPNSAAAIGTRQYAQVVTLNGAAIVGSNPYENLFVQ